MYLLVKIPNKYINELFVQMYVKYNQKNKFLFYSLLYVL